MALALRSGSSRYPCMSPSGLCARSMQISPSSLTRPSAPSSTIGYPGSARPIEPGLTETITDGDAPGIAHLCDDLGVERLTGTRELAQRHVPGAQLALNEHSPHRRRCAEARHAATHQLLEQC